MKLGLICAMEEELAAVLATAGELIQTREVKFGLNHGEEFTYREHQVVAAICGIGKVNAALVTQALIDKYALDMIINVGVAGSLSAELGFGDVVVATDLVEHDFDITPFGVPRGQIARMDTFSFKADQRINDLILAAVSLPHNKVVSGRIVSGDQFIDDGQKARELHNEFAALACEMEGAAVAHVCYVNSIPFAVIRSLSDMAGQDGQAIHSFNDLKDMAAGRAALVVKLLLERL